ncbi:unnamed protein product [Choristocarpus tenellus]
MGYLSLLLIALMSVRTTAQGEHDGHRRLSTKIHKKKMLLEHNIARCIHDTAPLKWSKSLANSSMEYAMYLAENMCGSLKHSERDGIGENLYTCGAYGSNVDPDSPCYTPERVMEGWYYEEVSNLGGHMTQVVWASTTKVGCGRATCIDGQFHTDMIVCQYMEGGNNGDSSQVKPATKSKEECMEELSV